MKTLALLACVMLPTATFAGDLSIQDAIVPLAPPGAQVHAAYMTIVNAGETAQQIIGVSAEGYAMAHIHQSAVVNDVATMTMVDVVEVAPGQSVMLMQGGLHIMLMKPAAPKAEGDSVSLTLMLGDGSTQTVEATVSKMMMKDMHAGHGLDG